MLELPQSFPLDAATTAFAILRGGEVAAKRETFFKCAWNLGGYLGNMVLDDDQVAGAPAKAKAKYEHLSVVESDALHDVETQMQTALAALQDPGHHAIKVGIDVPTIISLITTILDLIRKFRGK